MTSYPRMLVEGETLPPFVHPPCHYGALEHMAPECGESGRHRCLPEDLSVCAGLVGMFYARTEANARFVWDSIYAEARKLRDAVCVVFSFFFSPSFLYPPFYLIRRRLTNCLASSFMAGTRSGSSLLCKLLQFTCFCRPMMPRQQRRMGQLSFSPA